MNPWLMSRRILCSLEVHQRVIHPSKKCPYQQLCIPKCTRRNPRFNPWLSAPCPSHQLQCPSLRASVRRALSYYVTGGLDRSPPMCLSWKRDPGPVGRGASRCWCRCRCRSRSPLNPQTTRARTSSVCAHSTWPGWSVLLHTDRCGC